jgi:multiple sugar transport system permease protein
MSTSALPRPAKESPRTRGGGIRSGEGRFGWLFTAPAIVIIGVFLVLPIFLALWVSVSDWGGLGSPINSQVGFVGAKNFAHVLTSGGLAEKDFGTSIRNNLWFVVFVVPLQTALALFLAVQVNRRVLRGRSFFRTAYYFPSVTSAVAITGIFAFLFASSGAVNSVIAALGGKGPTWFADPRGLFHIIAGLFGVGDNPPALSTPAFLELSWWDWLAGPSVAMCVIIILVILTLPMLRPTLFTVLTLGLIGTWQIFDQIYILGQGKPAKTTLTPAFLAYQTSFKDLNWGDGAAISFILFAIIVTLTLLQRLVLRDRDKERLDRPMSRLLAREKTAAEKFGSIR